MSRRRSRANTYLGEELSIALLPLLVLLLQLPNVKVTSLQLRLRHASLLPERLELRCHGPDLDVKLPDALRVCLRVSTKGGVTFTKDRKLVDLLNELGVLSIGGGGGDSTFALLRIKYEGLTILSWNHDRSRTYLRQRRPRIVQVLCQPRDLALQPGVLLLAQLQLHIDDLFLPA